MSIEVPRIYTLSRPLPLVGWVGRLLALGVAAACATVLGIAATLTPSPSGVETHRQLGLAPCGLLRSTGVPCMTCGMTTSFAHVARGQVASSLRAQPMGTLLALLTAAAAIAGGYVAATGRPSPALLGRLPWARWVVALVALALLAWGYKVYVVVAAR